MNKQKRKAFTIVELVVAVTILTILSTIWFVAYSWYLISVRDTNRTTTIASIYDAMEIYASKHTLPLPEDKVEIKVRWSLIARQWYAWEKVLEMIGFSNGWKDPMDDSYYSYYLSKDKKNFQLMTFLEDGSESVDASGVDGLIDYSVRSPLAHWNELWILTDEYNVPVQAVTSVLSVWKIELDTTNSWTIYSAYIINWKKYTFSWSILADKIYSLSKPWEYDAPLGCPSGFIWVPWGVTFNQKWFCVAKYEMTFSEEAVWWATFDAGYNVYLFDANIPIVSRTWDYPIWYLTQQEAIDACKSMWKWYHLIMNKEWMTLARNIELENDNWSSWEVWVGWIFRWNNWEENTSLLWCKDGDDKAFPSRTWNDYTCKGKRQLKLSNSVIIEDMSWNLWEHVNNADTFDGSWYDTLNPTFSSTEWNLNTDSERAEYWPLFSYYNSSNWVWTTQTVTGYRIFLRWSSSDHTTEVWIYSMRLALSVTSKSTHGGFRCAYIKQ